jgi:hypothetical protein
MAYENKPRTISDKNRERSEEERTSLARQRGRRELNERKKQLQRQEDQELSRAGSRKERNEIRARADAALEQAEANFNETYNPSQNKQDYESDVLQRGIDQFTAPEATPETTSESVATTTDIVNNIFIFLMSGSTLTISRDTILSSYDDESNWSVSIPISSLAYNSGGTIAYDTNTALNVGTGSGQSIARIPIVRGGALVNSFGSYKEGLICKSGSPIVEYYKI